MAGLEDLYREIILDHYRAPRNRGELPVPPARKVEGFNPLCGDEVVLYLDVEDGAARSRSRSRASTPTTCHKFSTRTACACAPGTTVRSP